MDYPYRVSEREMTESRKEIFGTEPREYIVLIGGGKTYGAKIGNNIPPSATAYMLGWIDTSTGEGYEGKSLFSWCLSETEYRTGSYAGFFEEGKIYRIKGLPSKKSNAFYPLEVLGRVRKLPFLDVLWRKFNEPVYMQSELFGQLKLNKRYGYFWGSFNWLGTEIDVSFYTDEEEDEKCLANLEQFCREAERRDKEVRDYAADELTDLANYWRDDDHLDHEISEEEFKRRIKISSVKMSAEGDYDVWFEDDDMFASHSVHVSGDALGAPNYAQMEG